MTRKNPKKDELEKFRSWIKHLRDASKEKIILVSEAEDKKGLEEFGIQNIMLLRKPYETLIEDIAKTKKECVLLIDLHESGRKVFHQIKDALEKRGVKTNPRFRKFIFTTHIRNIGGIPKYLEKLYLGTRRKIDWRL